MRYTRLGRRGPVVSSIGLGSLALAGAYGRAHEGDADRLVRRALDAGVTLLDTSAFYAEGRVERLIGRAVAGRSDEVVVSTRGGVRALGPAGQVRYDDDPAALERDCDASLERLGAECIDLYYLHCRDGRGPVEESMGRLAELVRAGKIRYVGLTNGTLRQLREAHAVHPVTALGVEYSVWGRYADPDLIAAARELGIALVAARPLGRGFLTGRVRVDARFEAGDWRGDDPRFGPGQDRHCAGLQALEAAAAQLDLSAGRLALAWLLAQGEHTVPVPSTRSQVHLEMNLAAAAVELPPEVRDKLAGVFPLDDWNQSPSPLV
ncbi:aldo/keto reductase [Nonomuraea roseoviolacea]|uniref:Aryl-alcohol dehydrogenase-like predicted oxidoreductase n=1 Tax=Nonomuraea roseoviolacea subsp. carminata TaxID=160689 RepID=A0ABT1K4M2_9ACTN|nr:aldo/keto reductase [Nonomuraea roseoviolacea]MCP2348950.1 aryl-alcohol dehydrogenase-like predicted oxidoreductase [Nonomuraea roseoviolacea subsp. carminata]